MLRKIGGFSRLRIRKDVSCVFINMNSQGDHDVESMVKFDARYLAFLETISQLRPKLHRYCARMTGSVMDGEDVVQESLFNAYRHLETLEEGRPLAPLLFQIAHNRCIDFIRRRDVRMTIETS